jgi:NADH-quinone oxidoreductase subunit J
MVDSLFFYCFAGIAILGAVLLVALRNPIHSAVCLIITLLGTAGIFLQLHAEFLFIAYIILFVGGVVLLFIFVILLLPIDAAVKKTRLSTQKWVSFAVVLALGTQIAAMFWASRRIPGQGLFVRGFVSADQLPPNSEAIAKALFDGYLLPFEIAAVLLVVAIIGVVLMAKKRIEPR